MVSTFLTVTLAGSAPSLKPVAVKMFRVSLPAPPSIESKAVRVLAAVPAALMLRALIVSLPEVPTMVSAPAVSEPV